MTTNISAAAGVHLKAMEYGALALKSQDLLNQVRTLVVNQKETKRGKLLVLFQMKEAFGDEKMNELPIPDSKTGNNPDKYEYQGSGALIKSSFYEEISDIMFPEYLDKWNAIKSAIDKKSDAVEPYLTMSEKRLKDELKNASQDRTQARAQVKGAAKLQHVFNQLAELPLIDVEVDTVMEDGEEKLTGSTYPITIYEAGNHKNYREFSAGQIITLGSRPEKDQPTNLEAAIKAGGTLAAILKTFSKAPDAGQGQVNVPVKILINNVKQAEDYVAALGTYFDMSTDDGAKHRSALLALLANKDSDHVVKTVGDLCIAFDSIWTQIQARYDAMNQKTASTQGGRAAVVQQLATGGVTGKAS